MSTMASLSRELGRLSARGAPGWLLPVAGVVVALVAVFGAGGDWWWD